MGPEIQTGPEARGGAENPPGLASRCEASSVPVIEAGEELDHCVIRQGRPVDKFAGDLSSISAVTGAASSPGSAWGVIFGCLREARGDDDLLLPFRLGAPPPNSPAHVDGRKTLAESYKMGFLREKVRLF